MKIPEFASEGEEANWWYESQDMVSEEFQNAAKEGRLRIGSVRARLEGREPEFLPPMQIGDDRSHQ